MKKLARMIAGSIPKRIIDLRPFRVESNDQQLSILHFDCVFRLPILFRWFCSRASWRPEDWLGR